MSDFKKKDKESELTLGEEMKRREQEKSETRSPSALPASRAEGIYSQRAGGSGKIEDSGEDRDITAAVSDIDSEAFSENRRGAKPPFGGQGTVYDSAYDVNEELMKLRQNTESADIGKITKDDVLKATTILQKYKAGKANLETRIVDNEEWYRLQHWQKERFKKDKSKYKRATGWLFSAIDNKHADFMDNFPEVSVLPREQSDEQAAKDLTDILPVVFSRNNFKDVYSETCLYKLKNGTGIYSVLWDPQASGGLGDVKVSGVDALNLFWEPGVKNIQDSANIFYVELISNELLRESYPGREELRYLGTSSIDVTKYVFNESVDNSDKSSVVNWYYKTRRGGKTQLHYVRYVNDILLYASENDPDYSDRGWYDHGKYPFVFDVLNPDAGTPFGFGLIDVCRETQEDIDEMNSIMVQTVKRSSKRRYFVSTSAGINEEEFADMDKDFVHLSGRLDEGVVKEIEISPLSGADITMFTNKVQELKEISANRDVTAGSTSNSVTAASAIAALQESGNKTSRAMISKTYNAFKEICELAIELIRQFYTVPRTFRVLGDGGAYQYKDFDASALRSQMQSFSEFGVSFASKEAEFDLEVKTYKNNPYSRAAQNQDAVNFYNMGFFNPQNDMPSLAALHMLEFDNKEKVIEVIQKNGQTNRLLNELVPLMLQAVVTLDGINGTNNAAVIAAQLGIQLPSMPMPGGERSEEEPGEEKKKTDVAKTDAIGQRTREDHSVVKNAKARASASTAAR